MEWSDKTKLRYFDTAALAFRADTRPAKISFLSVHAPGFIDDLSA